MRSLSILKNPTIYHLLRTRHPLRRAQQKARRYAGFLLALQLPGYSGKPVIPTR